MRTLATIVLLLAALLLTGCHRGSYSGVYYTGFGGGYYGHHPPNLRHHPPRHHWPRPGRGHARHPGAHRDRGGYRR